MIYQFCLPYDNSSEVCSQNYGSLSFAICYFVGYFTYIAAPQPLDYLRVFSFWYSAKSVQHCWCMVVSSYYLIWHMLRHFLDSLNKYLVLCFPCHFPWFWCHCMISLSFWGLCPWLQLSAVLYVDFVHMLSSFCLLLQHPEAECQCCYCPCLPYFSCACPVVFLSFLF